MTLKRRRIEGLVLDADHDLGNVVGAQTVKLSLGARYARLVEIRARNWASAAKLAAGVDVLQRIRITDANNDVVFLDAADRDYATAEVTLIPHQDATVTGLGVLPVDLTGAAITGAAGDNPIAGTGVILEGPVLVAVVNGATATDFFTCDLIVEV